MATNKHALPMCCHMISYGDWGKKRACKNGGTIERDGKHYCSLHDPATLPDRLAKGEAKRQELLTKFRLQARAPAMKALLVALRERCPGIHNTDQVTGVTFSELIDKVLAD